MASDSFLPRIESVFYALFDLKLGPKIVYQVPEGLIAVPSSTATTHSQGQWHTDSGASSIHSDRTGSVHPQSEITSPISRTSSHSLASPIGSTSGQGGFASTRRSSDKVLFNFDDVSKYVIPHSALCGRLVTFATRKYRVIGFPAELKGNYERNYFRYNVCFVFDRAADLSCYEPIVRKISRVLRACEEESGFLSNPPSPTAMPSILEQLYEELNTYSETSIPIDKFNSIELKIFPFYPNPPQVKDWMVPLALINLSKRIEPNWDLTMQRICRHVDGTNHVGRISHLADCDIELTRQAVSHLLYHQVIMIIDIFQYSNMYTLSKAVQWLADESHVRDECGPYVIRPGAPYPDWPTLLHLYSRLKLGVTVFEWMTAHQVRSFNIDVRRFVTFGVIKGFLQRVHRWPLLLPADPSSGHNTKFGDKLDTFDLMSPEGPNANLLSSSWVDEIGQRGRTTTSNTVAFQTSPIAGQSRRPRKHSAAESVLEQLYNKDAQYPTQNSQNFLSRYQKHEKHESTTQNEANSAAPPSSSLTNHSFAETVRPRFSRSPSAPGPATSARFPPELLPLLDGEHHTDELCTRFQIGWPTLEEWLTSIGGGRVHGSYGRVIILYK